MSGNDADFTAGDETPFVHDSAVQRRLDAESAGLGAALGEQLRNAPWYMGSVGVHLIVFALLMLLPSKPPPPKPEPVVIDIQPIEEQETLEETPPPEDLDPEIIEYTESLVDVKNVESLTEAIEFVDNPVENPTEVAMDPTEDVFDLDVLPDTLTITVPNTRAVTGGGFATRGSAGSRRRALAGQPGVNRRAHEQRVNDALEWLKAHQEANGSWNAAKYGGGSDRTNVAVTGFATLAFLGAGNSPSTGTYSPQVRKAIEWLLNQQQGDGCIGPRRSNPDSYANAIALMAVTEAYGMARDRDRGSLRDRAQKAIDYAQRTQNLDGGWDYLPSNQKRSDLSVAGWYIMGLKSGKQAGLNVSKDTMDKALKFVDKMSRVMNTSPTDPFAGDAQGAYAIADGKITWSNAAMAAVALTAFQFLERPRTDEKVRLLGLRVVREHGGPPKVGTTDFYRWYYGALGLFQFGGDPELREDPTMKPYTDAWRAWCTAMVNTLSTMQVREGTYRENKGSWNPETEGSHGRAWGRVGQTAIGALMMEVFYRYDFVEQSRRAARRS